MSFTQRRKAKRVLVDPKKTKKEELTRITCAALDIGLTFGPKLDPPSQLSPKLCTWDQLKHRRHTYDV